MAASRPTGTDGGAEHAPGAESAPEEESAPRGGAVFELAGAWWPGVERMARRLLVVPVGSLEQHGPHLPLDTDTIRAGRAARAVWAGRLTLLQGGGAADGVA